MTNVIPKWSQLRPIGESTLAKSALAVPILGYLILLSGRAVDWFTMHGEFCTAGHCDVLWRLQCLYFGGCTFAIAAVIYSLACPPEIKNFSNAVDFSSAEKELLTGEIHDRFEAQLQRYLPHELENRSYKPHKLFPRIYEAADRVRVVWRSILMGFYVMGGVLVLIPTGYTFVQVLLATFR